MDHKMMPVISAVTDLIRPKWNIAYHTVEKAVRITGFLKSLYCNLIFLVKLFCDSARNRVEFHTVHIGFAHTLRDQSHKVTDTTGRLQDISLFQSHIFQCFIHTSDYYRGRIKSI